MGHIESASLLKREIAGILGRPPRTIQYWTDIGLVIPEIEPSQGKGKPRIYSGKNLLEFLMIDIMANHMNVTLETVKYILDTLRSGKLEGESEFIYVDYDVGMDEENDHFRDFFSNSEWGIKKELIYYDNIYFMKKNNKIEERFRSFQIIYPDEKGIFTLTGEVATEGLPWTHEPMFTRILWLGKLKNIANSRFGLIVNE